MLKRTLLSLVFACTFVITAQAAEKDLLAGNADERNEQYRADHYAAKLKEVYQNKNGVEALVADGDLLISQRLGSDFSSRKRVALNGVQRKMFLKQELLESMFQSGKLSESSYRQRLENAFRESFVNAGRVLSDHEFVTLFGFPKDKVANSVKEIVTPPPPQNTE